MDIISETGISFFNERKGKGVGGNGRKMKENNASISLLVLNLRNEIYSVAILENQNPNPNRKIFPKSKCKEKKVTVHGAHRKTMNGVLVTIKAAKKIMKYKTF